MDWFHQIFQKVQEANYIKTIILDRLLNVKKKDFGTLECENAGGINLFIKSFVFEIKNEAREVTYSFRKIVCSKMVIMHLGIIYIWIY